MMKAQDVKAHSTCERTADRRPRDCFRREAGAERSGADVGRRVAGRALRPALLWNDQRTAAECRGNVWALERSREFRRRHRRLQVPALQRCRDVGTGQCRPELRTRQGLLKSLVR
jgi:hypothetical protein